MAVEARVSTPMPTKAMDGFTEVPQMPFSQGDVNTVVRLAVE